MALSVIRLAYRVTKANAWSSRNPSGQRRTDLRRRCQDFRHLFGGLSAGDEDDITSLDGKPAITGADVCRRPYIVNTARHRERRPRDRDNNTMRYWLFSIELTRRGKCS